jgi:adenylylsulfate kinase
MSSPNTTLHKSLFDTRHRQGLNTVLPLTFWLTGLSGAGKSTLAYQLEEMLLQTNVSVFVLDGDNMRHGLCSDLGFNEADRAENIRRVAEVAKLMNSAGLVVVVALISPLRVHRAVAKAIIGMNRFREIYLNTPVAVCEQRDPKGLYSQARAGLIPDFTGISAPYEAPLDPDLAIETGSSPEQSAALLMALLNDVNATSD